MNKNNTNKENNQSRKCSCGSVQFDYAGRCLACKSKDVSPVENNQSKEKLIPICSHYLTPRGGCMCKCHASASIKDENECRKCYVDQSNTIGWRKEIIDILEAPIRAKYSTADIRVSHLSSTGLSEKVSDLENLLSQATQEAKQQGYDEAVKMCVGLCESKMVSFVVITTKDEVRNKALQDIINELTDIK